MKGEKELSRRNVEGRVFLVEGGVRVKVLW